MARPARVGAAVAAALVVALGGYTAADAADLVPGPLTTAPVPPDPAPLPRLPAAELAQPAPVATLDPAAPVPAGSAVQALVERAAADPRLGTSTGALVVDQLTGAVLAEVGADGPHQPASTAKLFTALAALDVLGPDRTLTTRVVRTSDGRVVLVGGGDVMLAAGAGDPAAVPGRAGLAELADATVAALRLAGQTTVAVGVDDALFTGPATLPAWGRPGYDRYVAPVSPLAVDLARTGDEEYAPRSPDPAGQAMKEFAAALTSRGVTVTGTAAADGAGALGTELAAVHSAPVGQIVEYMLHTSDNTVAEVLGRLVALESGLPGSFDGATQAVLRHAASVGVDVSGFRLADCSGLAEGSAVSARGLVGLLAAAADPQRAELRAALVDLPVAGWQGTLDDRFADSPARGLVRAKTGSLTGVTALAGTVHDADGRLLLFAIVADGTPAGGQAGPRQVIDALVGDLAACGCASP